MKHARHYLFIACLSTSGCLSSANDSAYLASLMQPLTKDYFSTQQEDADENESYISLWIPGYSRSANKAYSCNGNCKVPLSTLFFGLPAFKLRQAFADSIVINPSNPWINVSTLSPQLQFTDRGANISFEWARDIEPRGHHMRAGFRAILPVKSIAVTRQYGSSDLESESNNLDTVRCLSTEIVTGPQGSSTINNSFAYRLDFLSSLSLDDQGTPLVNYTYVPLTMNNTDITDNNSSPLSAIERDTTLVPNRPFAVVDSDLASKPFIQADGTGLSNDERGRFSKSTSYLALATNPNTQQRLWIVPTVSWNGSDYVVNTDASTIQSAIENVVKYQIDNSVIDYLTNKNLNFCSQQNSGLGDLWTQAFMQWAWPDTLAWTELNCAVIFPTGKKRMFPNLLLSYPLGNNGHVEIGPGVDAGWYPFDWLSLHGEASYFFALKAGEPIAASFCGACVKNIGPCTWADISWQYANVGIDANIIEQNYHEFGCNIGYHFYWKKADSLRFYCQTMADLEGKIQPLDACVATRLTQVSAHRVQGEVFFAPPIGAIFCGFSYMVHGKNIPLELAAYAGLAIEF